METALKQKAMEYFPQSLQPITSHPFAINENTRLYITLSMEILNGNASRTKSGGTFPQMTSLSMERDSSESDSKSSIFRSSPGGWFSSTDKL